MTTPKTGLRPIGEIIRPIIHSLSVCARCDCGGDDFGSVNVEAFELTGELYCEECAPEVIEEHGQFGVGA